MADGKDYVAKVEITSKDGQVLAAVGQTCESVPIDALGWLVQCEAIVLGPVQTEDVTRG